MASCVSLLQVLTSVACFYLSQSVYLRRHGVGPSLKLGSSKYSRKSQSFVSHGVRLRVVGSGKGVIGDDGVDEVPTPSDGAPEELKLFVSVFSARKNKERRQVIRDLLLNSTTDDSKARLLLKFHLCELNPEDQENASVREQALAEKEQYGDIVFLHCKEGLQRGKMATKAKLAMENYYKDYSSQSLFVHIEDDTFVPWKRALNVLKGFTRMEWIYMGEEIPEGTRVNRDKDSPWYQPAEVFAQEQYPQYVKKEFYILGKELVRELIESNIMAEIPLSNQDQAMGVWVDMLKQRGKPAYTLIVDPPSKNADGLQIHYSACNGRWAQYPFLWQHGLQTEDMQCLGKWDMLDENSQIIDSCLTDCEAVR